jgi:hypothetical protein
MEAGMAAEKDKDERSTSASTRRQAEPEDRKAAAERMASARASQGAAGGHDFPARRDTYLISLRHAGPSPALPGTQTIDTVVHYLERQEDVEIVARHKPAEAQPFAPDGTFVHEVVVARLADSRAHDLRLAAQPLTGQPQVIVERDAVVAPADGYLPPIATRLGGPSVPLSPVTSELALRVVGERDQPLARAIVVAFGSASPAQGVTDESGTARISLYGDDRQTVRAIYVRPRANHWERLVVSPDLPETGATTIRLRPLAEAAPPGAGGTGPWNTRLLSIDKPANVMTGAGVRVGIVGSGCDNTNPALRQVIHGKDFTGARSTTGWTDDVLGYGTHAAGLLAAAAPEAELHVFKVCPGGRISDLLAALDECIARELDVVCLSVACEAPSELLDQKLRELHHKGIACIAPAGPPGALQPPAFQSAVLTVGAVGRVGEFPPDTFHAQEIVPELVGSEGIFAAAFSGAGPHVGLVAPGVAVVSTAPGGQAALDGTGVAAAHITALAALVVAHHPLLQGALRPRSEQRVAALFGLLHGSAVPYFADPMRSGAGVPNLRRVHGLFATHDFVGAQQPMAAGMANDPFAMAQAFSAATAWPSTLWPTLAQLRAAGWI